MRSLRRLAGETDVPLKDAVDRVLREGLNALTAPSRVSPYRTKGRSLGILPGVDPYKLGQVADELLDRDKISRSQ